MVTVLQRWLYTGAISRVYIFRPYKWYNIRKPSGHAFFHECEVSSVPRIAHSKSVFTHNISNF